jgi:hypothetical protein
LPILLIVTFRPEYAPPWVGQARVTTLTLNRLDRAEGVALVRRIAGNEDLPDEIVAEIVERSDGVPLFVEELTKSALESGANDDGGSFIARASHQALAVWARTAPRVQRGVPIPATAPIMSTRRTCCRCPSCRRG